MSIPLQRSGSFVRASISRSLSPVKIIAGSYLEVNVQLKSIRMLLPLGSRHDRALHSIINIQPDRSSDLVLPYTTSIATISLPKASIYERLEAIKSAGFQSVELLEQDLVEILPNIPRFKKRVSELGLHISIFQPFRDLEGSQEGFEYRLNEFEKRLDIMKLLQIDMILLCSNCTEFTEFDEDQFIDQLRVASELAEKKGIKIAYETLSWGTYYRTLEDLWDVVKKVDRNNFGVCLDSFHIFILDCDPSLVKKMEDRIFFVQLSDSEYNLRLPNVIYHSRSYRNLPYQGSFNNLRLLELLDEVKYKGPLSLECFNEVFRTNCALSYAANESYSSLVFLMLELLKAQNQKLPQELSQGEVLGFISPSITGEVKFTDPQQPPELYLVVSDPELFLRRSALLGFRSQLVFRDIVASNNQERRNILVICSRLTFNSMVLYLQAVLQLKEIASDKEITTYGLPRRRSFGNGLTTITVVSNLDKQPVLCNSL